MIRIALLENSNHAFHCGHVETFVRGVIPKVIAAVGSFHTRHYFARFRIQHHKRWRISRGDEKTLIIFIEGHWENRLETRHWPFLHHALMIRVRYGDIAQFIDIDEDAKGAG